MARSPHLNFGGAAVGKASVLHCQRIHRSLIFALVYTRIPLQARSFSVVPPVQTTRNDCREEDQG